MKTYLREWALAGAVAAIVLIGLLIEGVAGEIARPDRRVGAGPRFVERAVFCPPSLANTKTFLAATAIHDDEVPVGIEPTRPVPIDLAPHRILIQQLPNDQPANVVGFGAQTESGVLVRTQKPFPGEAASRCADRAATRWLFAAGSSTLGADERILVYNPFPDEAVVRVSFLTGGAEVSKASLDDVAVPSRSAAFVRVNRFVRLQRVLAAKIEAERGRVVAWKILFDDPGSAPNGVQMSLGVTHPAPTWYFPEGQIDDASDTRIAIANPNSSAEATVTVSVSTGDRILQPEDLVEMPIAPSSARVIPLKFALPKSQRDLGGVSIIVQSTNGTEIVAERTIRYGGSVRGSTSETGASTTSTSWFVPPGTLNPSTDTLVVMNPGDEALDIEIEILRAGREPLAPAALSDRRLPSGGRLKIGLGEWTQGDTAGLLVTSSGPLVVERMSYSAIPDDVGSVMGVPLS